MEYKKGIMKYGDLHWHSENSTKDSAVRVGDHVKMVKKMSAKATAISDHGTLTGWLDLKRACGKEGIKPVYGVEAYVRDGSVRLHLIMYAVNDNGLKLISRMVSESNGNMVTAGGENYPCMTKEMVERHMKGHEGDVIATSACIGGVVLGIAFDNKERLKEKAKLKTKIDAASLAAKNVKTLEADIAEMEKDYEQIAKDAKKSFVKVRKTATKRLEKLRSEGADEASINEAEKELDRIDKEEDRSRLCQKLLPELRKEKKKKQVMLTQARKEVVSDLLLEKMKKDLESYADVIDSEDELLKKMESELLCYDNIFGHGNFFAEIQNHGYENEIRYMPFLASKAKEHDIPLVAANDAHMLTKDELEARMFINATRFNKWSDPKTGDDQLYIKDDAELYEALCGIIPSEDAKQAMENVGTVLDRCNADIRKETHYPKFADSKEEAEKMLEAKARAGIPERYPDWSQIHEDRLSYELGIINSMGFTDYFLIVQDFLEIGRKIGRMGEREQKELNEKCQQMSCQQMIDFINASQSRPGYSIGPGRGSGAGSIVCYLTGITAIDPMKYGLIFERFLNPERVSMPDIDSDLSKEVRELTIEYVRKRYGSESVAGIMTKGTLKAKAALQASARIWGSRLNGDQTSLQWAGAKLSDVIPKKEPNAKLDEYINEIRKIAENDEDHKELMTDIIDMALKVEGTYIQTGLHAAGVVIADMPVSECCPIMYDTKGQVWKTQYEKDDVEKNGMLKMDFLGLKNLDIITQTLRLVKENYGQDIDVEKLAYDEDPSVIEDFARGETDCVFQFESSGMKGMLRAFGPTTFEDLILLVACFRPGPMRFLTGEDGAVNVINVKHGEKVSYITPKLEPILKDTYGGIIYQEQVQQIFQQLAGYSLGAADLVRRAMGHKEEETLRVERESFINGDPQRGIKGCVANGIGEMEANKIFDQVYAFAGYGFNKSHATAYATVAYITAYLKHYYPAEYMAATLNYNEDNKKVPGYISLAKRLGVKVLPPDINKSSKEMTAGNGCIYFGLGAIAGLATECNNIIRERDENGAFKDLDDFILRMKVNKAKMAALAYSGCFDSICPEMTRHTINNAISSKAELASKWRSYIKEAGKFNSVADAIRRNDTGYLLSVYKDGNVPNLEKAMDKAESCRAKAEIALEGIRDACYEELDETSLEKYEKEAEYLQVYVSGHPLDSYKDVTNVTTIEGAFSGAVILGIAKDVNELKSKKSGKPFKTLTLSTKLGDLDAICFLNKELDNITEGTVLQCNGNIQEDERSTSGFKMFVHAARAAEREAVLYSIPTSFEEWDNIIDSVKKRTPEAVKTGPGALRLCITAPDGTVYMSDKYMDSKPLVPGQFSERMAEDLEIESLLPKDFF